jgi:hypothetical protein
MNAIAQKLKISQLRALVATAEWGTFSEAALQLEISQSAVSHAIAVTSFLIIRNCLKRFSKKIPEIN